MERRRLWVGGYGPEDSSHGAGLAKFRDVVEAACNGDVVVDVTWNIMDEGRPNTDLFDLVESGEMFLCYFSSSYLGERVPALNVLETPYLFTDVEAAHRSLDSELGDFLSAAVRHSTGFQVLGFWDNGFRHVTNRRRQVRSPTDCRAMTIRLQPNAIHELLFSSWGAVPVARELRAGIRLITSLEVDAQENPLANTVAYGVDAVHPHVTMTGHLYGARGLFAHHPTWSSFDEDLRAVITEAAADAVAVQRRAARLLEDSLRLRLEGQGVAFVDLTPEEHEAFVDASAPAIAYALGGLPRELLRLVS